jgi:electron transfer flavoprotein-quinone oxidoreductase
LEHFDVAIVGGGTAGFSALQQLSNLGKQAILIEAGRSAGTKNVSGGILYSKLSKYGKLYNIEDVFGQEVYEQAPLERRITKYMLHATSNDKVFSIDLTSVHEYQSNTAYSVLLSKLIPWLAKLANENAEKQGGGVVTGVHVKNVKWEKDKTILETDELEPFSVKAIIAADGVNSELAVIAGARPKFTPEQLYQGVKIIAKLPEELLEKRFDLKENEGAAHLFAGDITLDHIGGGFLYTNKATISLGAVYHYDSLLETPVEPYVLVDRLLKNPLVSEFVKDEVPKEGLMEDQLSKEDRLRARFAISKLTKNWSDLRDEYHSRAGRDKLKEGGRYRTVDEMKARLEWIRNELSDKYKVKFVSDYVELEYSAKLVPDGKRCRMKRPYHKNVLFVGDAAGRGIFVGPKIEGLNVGIDDAVRAANCVSRSIERNNFDEEYLGEFYTKSIEESPYTRDMMEIDKEYLKLFIEAAKDVPRDIIKARYGIIFRLMSSGIFRGLAVGFANILGYDRLLPMIETTQTYVEVPTELAERLGSPVRSTYNCSIPTIAERIAKLKYNDDLFSHIRVQDPTSEFMKKMVTVCPTKCYTLEQEKVMLQHEGCIECGSCALETNWRHPRGEKGIDYRYG